MPEARALHVLVRDFDHQFGAQWFPRQVLALAPAALASRHPLPGFACMLRPPPPRMIGQSIFSIWLKKFHELLSLLHRKAGADAYVLQRARLVEQAKQQRADQRALAFLVPAESGHHAIAIALVLHLQHHALVRLVGAVDRLGHDAIEPRAFETPEPIRP